MGVDSRRFEPAHALRLDQVQRPLDTVRPGMAGLLRQRPAVLPQQRSDRAPHLGQCRLPRLRPAEPVHERPMPRIQFTRPHPHVNKVPTYNHANDRPGQQPR